jgi:3-deoxy-D-manno-octulosonic-acid transferase
MSWLLNALYLSALALLSPWLIFRAVRTGRYKRGLGAKLLGLRQPIGVGRKPVWFHGVSVGEIHLLRQLIAAFRKRQPSCACVVSTTTETGYDEAKKAFPDLPIIFYPFDFSWAVRRTLRAIDPAVMVLAEGELWPNFLIAARKQAVPVAVINGRMSPRSFQRYRKLGPFARWLVRQLDLLAMQEEGYAANVLSLGAFPGRVQVTGNIKYDGVTTNRDNARTQEFRRLLNVQADQLVWIAGSTQAPEEEIVLALYQRLRPVYPRLRLILVPRHPQRFDEVAHLVEKAGLPLLRRSRLAAPYAPPHPPTSPPVVLGDTMGELSALWGLADVAFVGGSLDGKRGGQNMIEPAAFGASVVFGPHVWNFRDTVRRLLEANAACQVGSAIELEEVVRRLLTDPAQRQRMGQAAHALVLRQQGATERTLTLLDELLVSQTGNERAA